MTTTANDKAPAEVETVTLTIDGQSVTVPKGTLIIRAAEQIGIEIPRFCDHPALDPVGACRQCLVEVAVQGPDGAMRQMQGPPGRMKPQPSCQMTCGDGMDIKTQFTSPGADKAQAGVMELLLINHPLDCPVCDKGGECPLQNQAMSSGRDTTRFEDVKRSFPKPINISTQVLLDRDRCVLCQRCTRFSDQIAGDPFIALVERGALQQVGIYEEQPFESYFSGNTVQICPVGALTGAAYRFRSRPFDLVSTPSACEHCASGCSLRTDWRRGSVLRRMADKNDDVNEDWNCDKGRWAFAYTQVGDRIEYPMIREDGVLRVASWPEALAAAADGLAAADSAATLVGGRVSAEDAYAYAKFTRVALGSNDIDFRARPHSVEEADFLAACVAARGLDSDGGVSYADLENASGVVLAGFEPEEESPIVFLRLRKAVRTRGAAIYSVAPLTSKGLAKLSGTLLPTVPGGEASALDAIGAGTGSDELTAAGEALRAGGILLVGERLATVPGALSAAAKLAHDTGARLAWIPRRAGERGALDAGAIGGLLPGGHLVTDDAARDAAEKLWSTEISSAPGRDTAAILAGATSGQIDALVVAGVDPADLALPEASLDQPFVVSLELRTSAVTEIADVVLPVAAHAEKAGSFINWEGRSRPFDQALDTTAESDHRVLDMIGREMGLNLNLATAAAIRAEWAKFDKVERTGGAAPTESAQSAPEPSTGEMVLATWHTLLDAGRLQDGEKFLAGTAPATRALVSPASAEQLTVTDGDIVTVSTALGAITAPVQLVDMCDGVVWLPTNSAGSAVRASLGAVMGDLVKVTKGGSK